MKQEVFSLYKFVGGGAHRMFIRAASCVEAIDMWRVRMDYSDSMEPSSITCMGNEIDRPNIFE